MSYIKVTCPVCASAREVKRETLPPRRVHATCPVCSVRFPFTEHLAAPVAPSTAAPTPRAADPAPVPKSTPTPVAAPVAAPVPRSTPTPVAAPVPIPASELELDLFDDNGTFDPFPEGTYEAPPKKGSA